MLSVTGIVGGRNLQNEIIDYKTFIELFGVKVPESNILKILYNKVPKPGQESYGSPSVGKTKTLMCTFNGRFKGQNIKVQYFENEFEKPVGKAGGIMQVRTPRKAHFSHQQEYYFDENPELCVFILSTPQGKDSMIQSSQVRKIFKIDFPEQRAKNKNQSVRKMADIVRQVDASDEVLLRIVAQGIRVKGKTCRYRQAMTLDEVKSALFELAEYNQAEFIIKWEDKRTQMRGNIIQLNRNGDILLEHSGGYKIVKWHQMYGGAEITRFTSNKTLVEAVMEHNMDPTNRDSFQRSMKSILDEKNNSKVAKSDGYKEMVENITTLGGRMSKMKMQINRVKITDLKPLEQLKFAIDNEILFKDLRKKTVYLMDEGEVLEDTFFQAAGSNLTKELEHYVQSKEGAVALQKLLE